IHLSPILIRKGFSLYTENNVHILISSTGSDEAFLNSVQQFNFDMSIAEMDIVMEEMFKKRWERDLRVEQAAWEKSKGLMRCPMHSTKPFSKLPPAHTLELLVVAGPHYILYAKESSCKVRYFNVLPSVIATMKKNMEIGGFSSTERVHDAQGSAEWRSNLGKIGVQEDDA
ncbi:hypothetical protein OG21DRAFT_1528383, partial [Imleria badia]